jgi:hypothetical protein
MNVDPNQPVSWRAVPEDVPVRSSEGTEVGRLHDLLASDQKDIFHGIVVRLSSGKMVFVAADDVAELTESHVNVGLSRVEIEALPGHDDQKAFDLGWVGVIRKHVGWIEEKDR